MEKFIIIDLKTSRALYGVGGRTLNFSTYEIASEVAIFFFSKVTEYIIVPIRIEL
jgi:hypothetical protein